MERPDELRRRCIGVAIRVEDFATDEILDDMGIESPFDLMGLYQGVPLTGRTSAYAAVPPDKISIYRGPLERIYGGDSALLQEQIRRVVLHEVAHHFGISDERLRELDRY